MSLALQAWIALTVVFVVGEIVSPKLLLLPFGIGAGAAALVEANSSGSGWQWVAFVGVSTVALVVFQRVIVARRKRR